MKDFIFKIDHCVAKFFHNIYLWGGEASNTFMEFISLIAEAGILFLLIGFGLALFKRTRKVGATILISVALGFLFTNIILKNVIGRARPFQSIGSDFYKWWLDTGASYEGGYSFPSGHTTATTAFAFALFLTTNKKYSWYISLLPIAMASSRIYLMVHYFTDCLGGLVVGILCALIAYMLVKLIYLSQAKFFVWVREFNVFKPKSIATIAKEHPDLVKQSATKESVKVQEEDFIYSTLAEETGRLSNQNGTNSAKEDDVLTASDNSDAEKK